LSRRGFVTPQPHKRPRSSYVRFEADMPNERWQADVTHWKLADGIQVEVLNVLDDHARFLVATHARTTTKAADVVATFHHAAAAHGFPASVLADNGAIFAAAPRGGGRCAIELELAQLGIGYRHARAYHPQTCGKVERFHQTLKRWPGKQPAAQTVAELQAQLDAFASYYNTQRPHRALGRRTQQPPMPPGQRQRRHRLGSPSQPTIASGATRSTTPGSSPCATTAGCTTSGSAAATPASTSWSWWLIWMCGCSPRMANCCGR
jgi:transposase InsO family protein